MYYPYPYDQDQVLIGNPGPAGPPSHFLQTCGSPHADIRTSMIHYQQPPTVQYHSYDPYEDQAVKYGTYSHRTTHHHRPHVVHAVPMAQNHVPFTQRLFCEHHQQMPHQMQPRPGPGLARVHSFSTRVYVNPEPLTRASSSNRLSRYPSRIPSTLRKSRPPSFAHRYHSAERPIKRPRNEVDLLVGNSKYRTLPNKPKRWPSTERPFKRLKTSESTRVINDYTSDNKILLPRYPETQSKSVKRINRSGSYCSLPSSQKSQKVVKTASFHFSSPFSSSSWRRGVGGVKNPAGDAIANDNNSITTTLQNAKKVHRENSLTEKLQNQSMGIHKLILDQFNKNYSNNNNNEPSAKCQQCQNQDVLANNNDREFQCCGHIKYPLLSLEEQRKLVKFRRFLSAANVRHKTEFLSRIKAIRRRQEREARRSIVDEHGIPASYYLSPQSR